jgi:hypothetical protein
VGMDAGNTSTKSAAVDGQKRRADRASAGADPGDHSGGIAALAQDRDLLKQFLALGLDRSRAERLFQQGCAALDDVLSEIDLHAFVAVPVADQVSMLLPRLNIERVAESAGVSTAQAQSAMALLALDFATRVR